MLPSVSATVGATKESLGYPGHVIALKQEKDSVAPGRFDEVLYPITILIHLLTIFR